MFILIFYVWNTTISSLVPIVTTFYRYFFGDGIYQIALNIYFRFDIEQFLIEEISLFLLEWNHAFCCAVSVAVEIIYISILSALCLQFEAFNRKISKIDFKLSGTKNKIKKMVEHHVELTEVCDLVDEIFSTMILINIVNGAVILCFLGFELLVRCCYKAFYGLQSIKCFRLPDHNQNADFYYFLQSPIWPHN